MKETLKRRIVFLWILIMVGFVLHNLTDVLPLFWGVDIALDASGEAPQGLILFMMLLSFLVPGAGCLCMLYGSHRWLMWGNVGLAMLVMLFNFSHSVELLETANWGQYIILPMMDVLGVLLFVASVRLIGVK